MGRLTAPLRGLGRGLPLYGALLVLPAVVLMVLHGHGLYRAYVGDRDAIPLRADNDQLQLARLLRERVQLFVDDEEQRPFFEYARMVSRESITEDLVLMGSPLAEEPAPAALQAWFYQGDGALTLVTNQNSDLGPEESGEALAAAVAHLERPGGADAETDVLEVPMVTAAVHANDGGYQDCLRDCLPLMQGRTVSVEVSRFELVLFRDDGGTLRLAALRRVTPAVTPGGLAHGVPLDMPKAGPCLDVLAEGVTVVQGFLVDPTWVFRGLAEELAPLVLDQDTRLVTGPAARAQPGEGELKRTLDLVGLLDVTPAEGLVLPRGDLALLVDTKAPRARFRASILRFGAVGLMMVLSLGTGLLLLLGNVRTRLEQARRTENFVAAVTHELRTPLASIRLHGEMLSDGIVVTDEGRSEYYQRILGETERLSLLVENVLQKSSLDSEAAHSEPGDLSEMVGRMQLELDLHGQHYVDGEGGPGELVFDLAEGLPDVALHWDAINGILRNLVGNARKYGAGTVEVRTRSEGGEVLLEVLDRGPGVPRGEERRVFEAFYRTGEEATREKPGTGLGLHLVQLHAAALGAEARYRHREGGGAAFEVAFRPAS